MYIVALHVYCGITAGKGVMFLTLLCLQVCGSATNKHALPMNSGELFQPLYSFPPPLSHITPLFMVNYSIDSSGTEYSQSSRLSNTIAKLGNERTKVERLEGMSRVLVVELW